MLNPYYIHPSFLKFRNNICGMRLFLGLCVILLLNSCAATLPEFEKMNGVSFVAARDSISEQHVKPLMEISANYAAIMPFGFVRNDSSPQVIHDSDRQWFGETLGGTKQYVKELQERGIKIMLKPQLWYWHGKYTGTIEMHNEADWKVLESTYAEYILSYAKLAQELEVSLFCIGTELEMFVTNREDYWKNLIKEIRKLYNGPLTYAANWDEYKRTPFWGELDFIGIDAYFPVSEMQTPTVEDCKEGWKKHLRGIEKMVDRHEIPVVFTEFGYRSTDYTGKEPWDANYDKGVVNLEAQSNAMQALFETFWDQPWFAGGFIWKWFHYHERVGGNNNHMFTPQNKPVQNVIKSIYSGY